MGNPEKGKIEDPLENVSKETTRSIARCIFSGYITTDKSKHWQPRSSRRATPPPLPEGIKNKIKIEPLDPDFAETLRHPVAHHGEWCRGGVPTFPKGEVNRVRNAAAETFEKREMFGSTMEPSEEAKAEEDIRDGIWVPGVLRGWPKRDSVDRKAKETEKDEPEEESDK